MSSRLALPLLLFLALVASATFWFLSEKSERGGGDLPRGADAVATVDPQGELKLPEFDVDRPEPRDQERRVADELAPAIETQPASEERNGIRLTGTVLNRDGTPVPGARVLASAGNEFGFSLDMDNPFARRFSDLTDEKGRYVIDGLAPGKLQVAVRAGGYAPLDRSDLALPADEEFELEPLTLSLGAVLAGHVLDSQGEAVAGAELFRVSPDRIFFPGGKRDPVAVSELDGSFLIDQMALGEWNVLVTTEDHPDARFEGLAERPGEVLGGLEFVLEPGTTISGRVTQVPAAEVGKLRVTARKASNHWFESFGGRTADVDRQGRFTIRGAALETEYELTVRLRPEGDQEHFFGNSTTRAAGVSAWGGDEDVEIVYQPEAALLFQVVDAETRGPIEEFDVEAGAGFTRGLRSDEGSPVRLHPEGRVRFGGLRPEEKERVELVVRATGYREYRREGIALVKGQELDLGQIFLEPVPVVNVTVLDAAGGTPVAGATVSIEKEVARQSGRMELRMTAEVDDSGHMVMSDGHERVETDRDGLAVLTSLPGETVTLRVDSQDHAPYVLGGIALPIGQSLDRTVELFPGGTVVVSVLDPEGLPVPGVRVAHQAPSAPSTGMGMHMPMRMGGPGGGGKDVTDSEGNVTFHQLESGTHRFKIQEAGGGAFMMGGDVAITLAGMPGEEEDDSWTPVDVLEGGEAAITLHASARGSLAGRVLEAGKLLTGARVSLTEKKQGGGMSFGAMAMMGGGGGPSARTGGDGDYLIEGLEEGEYTVKVAHPTRRMPAEFDLEIRPGENNFDMDLPVSILEGRITDENGKGLEGISVRAERYREGQQQRNRFAFIIDDGSGPSGGVIGGEELGGDSGRTDADGRYSLRGVASDVQLVVIATGTTVQERRSDPVTVASGETLEGVNVALQQAGTVRVEVFDSQGDPAGFTMVRATFSGKAEGVEPEMGFTNDDGVATLTGLRPGPWKLSASRPGEGGQGVATEQDVDIVAGEELSVPVHME